MKIYSVAVLGNVVEFVQAAGAQSELRSFPPRHSEVFPAPERSHAVPYHSPKVRIPRKPSDNKHTTAL